MNKRALIYGVLIVFIAGYCSFWAWETMADAATSAKLAATQRGEVADLAKALQTQTGPRKPVAQTRPHESHEIQLMVEQVAKKTGIGLKHLIDIRPQHPLRIEQTNYREYPTMVRIESTTLTNLIKFSHAIKASGEGLSIKSINLRPSPANAEEEIWDADLVFVYIVYEPL